jgi:hypothetical protein
MQEAAIEESQEKKQCYAENIFLRDTQAATLLLQRLLTTRTMSGRRPLVVVFFAAMLYSVYLGLVHR